MRYYFFMGLILLLPVLILVAPAQATQSSTPTSCRTISAKFLQNLEKGDFADATAHFDSKMKAAATPAALEHIWNSLAQKYGSFERSATPEKLARPSFTNIITPLEFANGSRNMVVSCNTEGRIQGLFFHPATPPGNQTATLNENPADSNANTATSAPQSSTGSVAKSCLRLSANLLQNLQAGAYDAASAHFGARMQSFGPQRTKQGWQEVQQLFGKFERAAKPKLIREHGKTAVMTPLQFANSWGKMATVCNDKGRIVVWNVTPASAPGAPTTFAPGEATTAWIAAAAVGATTLPIAIQRNGFMLKGVLDLPAGKGPFGVVDIIPGSGPISINGNAGRIQDDMYKQLASALVKAGWAVARVAKRYIPPSTGNTAHYAFADQVADNLAIIKALKNNPHINPKRIVAAGHSLGGLIAPKLAIETELAGLILLEAPGTPMTKISTTQVLEANRKAGASATKLKAITKLQNKFYARLAKAASGQTVSVAGKVIPPGQAQLFKSWYAQKPLAAARKVEVPVLVVQGGKDTQVTPGNGKRLVKALPHGRLLYLPNMDHDLTLEKAGTGKDATLAPKLTAGIVDWLNRL